MIVRRALKNDSIVAGGGAIEMVMSKYLRDYSRTIAGKEQLLIGAMAKAFEIIPRQLCDNAGFDATNILNKLRQRHAAGDHWAGVDINAEDVANTFELCVWEPAVVKRNAIARIPKHLKPENAAPLMCAGLTTFNALRNSTAKPGDIVVVQGLGGLGHLGIQFARKMGFHTIAVSRGSSKAELAKSLGAHEFFDSETQDIVKEIKALGGARVILSTVTDGKAVEQIFPALGMDGEFILVGAIREPISINTLPMLSQRQTLKVWPSGNPKDIEDTLKFAALQDIKPVVEEFPLEKAHEAYEHAMSNKARFRAVIRV